MCLPMNLTREQVSKRCELVEGYKSDTYFESMNVLVLILILIGAFIILYGLTMIGYYNYRFYKDGEPPFPVFSCCPTFVFPKGQKVQMKEEVKARNDMDYYLYEFEN